MSDLTTASCNCQCDNGCNNGCSSGFLPQGNGCGCNIIWILLLLGLCGNNNCGQSCGCDNGCGNNTFLIILLLLFCNGNNSCGCGFDC